MITKAAGCGFETHVINEATLWLHGQRMDYSYIKPKMWNKQEKLSGRKKRLGKNRKCSCLTEPLWMTTIPLEITPEVASTGTQPADGQFHSQHLEPANHVSKGTAAVHPPASHSRQRFRFRRGRPVDVSGSAGELS